MFGWLQNIFGHKASAVAHLISFGHVGQPTWSDRNYANFAKEGYKENDVTYFCVNEIAKAVASVPWKLYRGKPGQTKQEITSHPILDLIERPNSENGKSSFFQWVTSFLIIAGNCYIHGRGPDGGDRAGEFDKMDTLRPDRMVIIPGEKGVAAYRYEVNGQHKDFPVDPKTEQSDILHIKLFNPLNDWYGMSPIEAAAYGIDIYNEGNKWNKGLLENSARVGGKLKHPSTMGDVQYNRLKEQIDTKRKGGKNAGRPIILEDGIEWVNDTFSPKDMEFNQGEQSAARKICRATGVPAQMAGIPGENKYANMAEAHLHFWLNTVFSYLGLIRTEYNNWLTPRYTAKKRQGGESIYLDYDISDVPALALRRDKNWERANTSSHLTINEKRALTGQKPIDGGDTILVPATMIPLDLAVSGDFGDDDNTDAGKARFVQQLRSERYSVQETERLVKLAFGGNGEAP